MRASRAIVGQHKNFIAILVYFATRTPPKRSVSFGTVLNRGVSQCDKNAGASALDDTGGVPPLNEAVPNDTRGRVWLHCSSGLGKTILALLLARRQSVPWAVAVLRDLKGSELRTALTRLNEYMVSERGLILSMIYPRMTTTI